MTSRPVNVPHSWCAYESSLTDDSAQRLPRATPEDPNTCSHESVEGLRDLWLWCLRCGSIRDSRSRMWMMPHVQEIPMNDIFERLKRGYARAKDLLQKAKERERQHLLDSGWTQDDDGAWHLPDGRPAEGNVFDGPGSHVSLFHHLEVVCREEGVDVSSWEGLINTLLSNGERDG